MDKQLKVAPIRVLLYSLYLQPYFKLRLKLCIESPVCAANDVMAVCCIPKLWQQVVDVIDCPCDRTSILCHIRSLFSRTSLLSSACDYWIVGMVLMGKTRSLVKLILCHSNQQEYELISSLCCLHQQKLFSVLVSCGGSGSRLSAASERGGMSKPIQGFIS